MNKLKSKAISMMVIAAFSLAVIPVTPVSAAMVGTDRIVGQQSAADARVTVDTFMERANVEDQFEKLGVDPTEAKDRVAALSDDEVAQLAERIDSMPAGQGAVGAVIGAAVLIFIVLLITDLLGFTSVFPFTNKGAANPT